MNKNNMGQAALYLSLTVVLAACGGGGGSGGKDQSGGGTIELDTGGYADRAASMTELSHVDSAAALYADVTNASDLIWEVEDRIESWGQPEVNGNVFTLTCENGSGKVVVTIESDNVNDKEHWQFTNCEVLTPNYGRVLLNGTYQYVNVLAAESAVSENWIGYEAFAISGTFLGTGEALKLQGREDRDERNSAEGYKLTSRIKALEFMQGDRYVAISDAVFDFAIDEEAESYTLTAKLIGSAINGYVNLSTPERVNTPFVEPPCSDAGVVRMEGEGYAEVRYGTSTGTGDAVVVEVNGSPLKVFATCAEVDPDFNF